VRLDANTALPSAMVKPRVAGVIRIGSIDGRDLVHHRLSRFDLRHQRGCPAHRCSPSTALPWPEYRVEGGPAERRTPTTLHTVLFNLFVALTSVRQQEVRRRRRALPVADGAFLEEMHHHDRSSLH
jgi:hypothetical protein